MSALPSAIYDDEPPCTEIVYRFDFPNPDVTLLGELARYFWARVARSEPDACWLWTGPTRTTGEVCDYGDAVLTRRRLRYRMLAHRLSYLLAHGSLPDDACVLHRCDVPLCVNPAHLFLGTRADNNADKTAKGRCRASHGSANPGAKVTEEQARQIRARRAAGERGVDLAREFGVSPSHIALIHRGKTWRHA